MAKFELIVSGLCALVLRPCPTQSPDYAPNEVVAVLPGGDVGGDMEHTPWLIADFNDWAGVGRQPDRLEPRSNGGYDAYWKLKGQVTVTVDGKQVGIDLKKLHADIMHLGNAVKDKPNLEHIKDDVFRPKPDPNLSKASLHFPYKPAGGVIAKLDLQYDSDCSFEFQSQHKQKVADGVRLGILGSVSHVVITMKSHAGIETIELQDGDGTTSDKLIPVAIQNTPEDILAMRGPKLYHFPLYYQLSEDATADMTPPECKNHDAYNRFARKDDFRYVKPVACATCQGCDP